MRRSNNEVIEFNLGQQNQKRIASAQSFSFVSCPDFTHTNGEYDYRGLESGIPLSVILVINELKGLSTQKPIEIFISDHEMHAMNGQPHLKMSPDDIIARINGSLEAIRGCFPSANLLSVLYPYERVVTAKSRVPRDYQMERCVAFADPNKSMTEREHRYIERYAEMLVFLESCLERRSCAVFTYSKYVFNLVAVMRRNVLAPILFIEPGLPR
ncbi:MAG TPA: hypothetical protein VJJ72_03105 [Candidatus Paceibacterota bacterium]